ncbi:MAG TPA: hypothetical protein DCM08_06305 [Microscillaceae bacterium]|jgi:hypothetical protein|nr:hypothetical protein [Microscillaceae bacterium]
MRLPKLIVVVPWMRFAAGMAIFPFILLADKQYRGDKHLLNHELIHLQQQIELLIIPFYLLYLLHYGINLVRFRDHHRAYLEIFFEREAYQNEHDLSYLGKRRFWRSFRYLFKSAAQK